MPSMQQRFHSIMRKTKVHVNLRRPTKNVKSQKWVDNSENEMKVPRKRISQSTEEIRRVQNKHKFPKTSKRNRRWMSKELKGRMSLQGKVTLKEKKKINVLKILKKRAKIPAGIVQKEDSKFLPS